jgi:hypothetical protein
MIKISEESMSGDKSFSFLQGVESDGLSIEVGGSLRDSNSKKISKFKITGRA